MAVTVAFVARASVCVLAKSHLKALEVDVTNYIDSCWRNKVTKNKDKYFYLSTFHRKYCTLLLLYISRHISYRVQWNSREKKSHDKLWECNGRKRAKSAAAAEKSMSSEETRCTQLMLWRRYMLDVQHSWVSEEQLALSEQYKRTTTQQCNKISGWVDWLYLDREAECIHFNMLWEVA